MQGIRGNKPVQVIIVGNRGALGNIYQPITSRALDYQYDPIYTVSGSKDHYRAVAAADKARKLRMVLRPVFRTMFSELPRLPGLRTCLTPRIQPPPKDTSGPAEYKVQPKEPDVDGADRYKYFRRPNYALLQQFIPSVRYAPAYVPRCPPPLHDPILGSIQEVVEEMKKTVTQGTQTKYRESEAQTEPYAPPYKVRSMAMPEVLDIAHFSWGQGIPAGMQEVETIDRIREKKAILAALPDLEDEAQKGRRQRMLADLEMSEWIAREMEIERMHILQHEVWERLYEKRKQASSDQLSQKLDRIWAELYGRKERAMIGIRHKHERESRRLLRNFKAADKRFGKRDIVQEYASKASKVYAPATRYGNALTDKGKVVCIRNQYLDKYSGLKELEKTSRLLDYKVKIDVGEISTVYIASHKYIPRRYRTQQQLEYLQETAAWLRTGDKDDTGPLYCVTREETPEEPPATPTIPGPHPLEEERYQATICLQKMVYGRAIHTSMYYGKEEQSDLITELQTMFGMMKEEKVARQQERESLVQLQKERDDWMVHESSLNEILERLEGGVVGRLLDFLSKELVRLQDERKIHAFALLAERQRVLREAQESGKRQVEERARREVEQLFKRAVCMTQASVDTYLEDLIMEGTQWTAETEARKEVQEQAWKMNEIAHMMEESANEIHKEEMVGELVHGFLLPESRKKLMRERVKHLQEKQLSAAHVVVNAMFHKQKEVRKAKDEVLQKVAMRKAWRANLHQFMRGIVEEAMERGRFPQSTRPSVLVRKDSQGSETLSEMEESSTSDSEAPSDSSVEAEISSAAPTGSKISSAQPSHTKMSSAASSKTAVSGAATPAAQVSEAKTSEAKTSGEDVMAEDEDE